MNISTDTLHALRNGSVDADALRLEGLPLPAERVVKGDARVGVVELVEHNGVSIGVWEITPSVSTDVEVDEVFVVLSGAAEVTFADGSPPLTLRPGTVGRLAAGAQTTWHVTETLRKIYIA